MSRDLFNFDPVVAKYNEAAAAARHGMTEPIVVLDLGIFGGRWHELETIEDVAALVKRLAPEVRLNENDLGGFLSKFLTTGDVPKSCFWPGISRRFKFQTCGLCQYCGEKIDDPAADDTVLCARFKRAGGCRGEAHRDCVRRFASGVLKAKEPWTCELCVAQAAGDDAPLDEPLTAPIVPPPPPEPPLADAPPWFGDYQTYGEELGAQIAHQRDKLEKRRWNRDRAEEIFKKAEETVRQAKSLKAGVLNLEAFLACLDDASTRTDATEALVRKMASARADWDRDLQKIWDDHDDAAAKLLDADGLVQNRAQKDEYWLQKLEEMPEKRGVKLRLIAEPNLDAWGFEHATSMSARTKLLIKLQKQLTDVLDDSIKAFKDEGCFKGKISSGVATAPPDASDDAMLELALWTTSYDLIKTAAEMDLDIVPERVDNVSVVLDQHAHNKLAYLTQMHKQTAHYVLYRKRQPL